ncbi:SDR family NAD(P)-dependent oxidoreductase [Patulibacter defluvii]|uniref:SDR family NAD(P)-dependent oxidoreductase n=1 Tax=Patulibacter defluvii TaxID=3095358 RepID=UPI002A7640DC|nr:SDR family oxidoreductase [Patulibacter sp. DM4]
MTSARLTGRVAVVTGAANGIGRAIALRLAAEGAAVACLDLDPTPRRPDLDGPLPTHELIAADGVGRAIAEPCDVGDGDAVRRAFAATLERLGGLDVVVANAGISPQPATELPEEDPEVYARTVRVNQDGVWWTAREACRILRDRGQGGRIVLTASVAGLVGGTGAGAHYCMTKAAVAQLARALAVQMGPYGITVNAVSPGMIRSPLTADHLTDPETDAAVRALTPLGTVGEPDDIAAAVAFLASDDARFVTGVDLAIDGGYLAR